MTVQSHGEQKYRTGRRLTDPAELPSLRVELWRHGPGRLNDLTLACTEIAVLLSGESRVKRTGNGERQETVARPGTFWICPTGTHESDIEVSAPMGECLHVFLPPTLVEQTALETYGIDPARVELAYAGGLSDPTIAQIGTALRGLLERPIQPTDRLFADGLRTALAGHLFGAYTIERWRPAAKTRGMDGKRLKRVLDYIEARLAAEISLEDLAAEACLSPFHFSRQFRLATGLSPHRWVTERRITAAKDKLAIGRSSLVEIALDTGFGSQANFNRVFRKATGLTPGQYRSLHAR